VIVGAPLGRKKKSSMDNEESKAPEVIHENVITVAGQLCDYLQERQDAADTYEGLIRWWLYRQRLLEAEKTVTQAINYLLVNGKIEKRQLADGNTLYIAKK